MPWAVAWFQHFRVAVRPHIYPKVSHTMVAYKSASLYSGTVYSLKSEAAQLEPQWIQIAVHKIYLYVYMYIFTKFASGLTDQAR